MSVHCCPNAGVHICACHPSRRTSCNVSVLILEGIINLLLHNCDSVVLCNRGIDPGGCGGPDP